MGLENGAVILEIDYRFNSGLLETLDALTLEFDVSLTILVVRNVVFPLAVVALRARTFF